MLSRASKNLTFGRAQTTTRRCSLFVLRAFLPGPGVYALLLSYGIHSWTRASTQIIVARDRNKMSNQKFTTEGDIWWTWTDSMRRLRWGSAAEILTTYIELQLNFRPGPRALRSRLENQRLQPHEKAPSVVSLEGANQARSSKEQEAVV